MVDLVRPGPTTRVRVHRVDARRISRREDHVVTEEPLEIRLTGRDGTATFGVTMRTPGHDVELAVGLLHSEGLMASLRALRGAAYCTDPGLTAPARYNVLTVELAGGLPPLPDRRMSPTSACGVCGAAAIDDLALAGWPPPVADAPFAAAALAGLPAALRATQRHFDRTGGLHAAGLATADGRLLVAREDVGRHNAVDKVVGRLLLDDALPASGRALVVSGRAGYEIAAKAVAAGIPAVVAVSAASSLAVEVARRFGLLLAGFTRDGGLTVYAGAERLA
jgi:FdhD protein